MTPMPIYSAILRGRFEYPREMSGRLRNNWQLSVTNSIKVDAAPLTDACFSHATSRWGDMAFSLLDTPTIYPNCIPPWGATWIEWNDGKHFAGAFVAHFARHTTDFFDEVLTSFAFNKPNIEHIIQADSLYLMLGSDRVFSPTSWAIAMDREGAVVDMGYAGQAPQNNSSIHMPLYVFSLANCKNVSPVEEKAEYTPKGFERGRQKVRAFYRYHVLKISGSFTGTPHESKGGTVDKAMHICRGHFAKYTDDKPLFGKYTGLFWRPMHVRGSVKNGVVDKDYQLVPSME